MKDLNTEALVEGLRQFLAAWLIAAVRRTNLRRPGSIADQGNQIIRAVDVLMAGV